MNNVLEKLTPNPVTHEYGENGCCKSPREWEMEMMHQVWAAGLHDAANCFQDALEAKWKLESQRKGKPKTNGDKIREMADEELAKIYASASYCDICHVRAACFSDVDATKSCYERFLEWLRSPAEGSNECNDRNRGET